MNTTKRFLLSILRHTSHLCRLLHATHDDSYNNLITEAKICEEVS